ncbi:hypothetical protein CW736_11230 [Nonlabens sp. MB-3u-79]|uniref:hypothetical protein n=1 Tax=Nonlabens sp. MB-3u-79 TaxID=2058134 RepID=UPI000C3081D2|nr:hypothetical protein [Nonlabens sp. MB-3u-79]AUC79901.1 hypothetical protein CW736_11230 [Nonlabens sp. MB-3u-79]
MKSKVTLLLYLLTISFTYGQYEWTPGKILLQNSDTIHGEIKLKRSIYDSSSEKVEYRATWDSEKLTYGKYLVKEISFEPKGFDTVNYRYINVNTNQQILVRIITSGEVMLYARYNGRNGLETYGGNYWQYDFDDYNEFYVKHKDKKVAELIIGFGVLESFKKRSLNYFKECTSVVTDIKDRFYRKRDIQFIVEDYNYCISNK